MNKQQLKTAPKTAATERMSEQKPSSSVSLRKEDTILVIRGCDYATYISFIAIKTSSNTLTRQE
jgi:hypothetical protein